MARGRPKKRVREPKDQGKEEIAKPHVLNDQDIEHRITALRAIADGEIARVLNQLRLLHSLFTKEQLETPLTEFLKENCPHLSVVKNPEYGEYELQRKEFMVPLDPSNILPTNSGFEIFSRETARQSFLKEASTHIPDFVFDDNFDTQMLGMQESFRTPGVNSQRLSVGVTPKTVRLPKNGEMLLSVHGSPLGVYRHGGGMEVIDESDG